MRLLMSTKKCPTTIGFLLLMQVLLLGTGAAVCSEGICYIHYSIHLASFKNLQNANGYVNTLAKKEKMVFWKKTEVPGKGEFYRVYLGKYRDRAKAIEFWKILKEEGKVSYFGIHEFRELILPEKIEKLPNKALPEEKHAILESPPIYKKDRFMDNGDGTVTDTVRKLMWIKNGWRIDFFSAVQWKDALKKCEQFKLGGYTNWRLPTIKEWKSLLDTKKESPALVEPNPFENIIVHMPYWSQTAFIVGSEKASPAKSPSRAYTVMLYYGRINHQNINERAFILPVRSIE